MAKPATVIELLSSPDKWTKHNYMEDKDGKPIFKAEDATKFCLSAAFAFVYADARISDGIRIRDKLFEAIRELYPDIAGASKYHLIPDFNDHPSVKFEDIKRMLELAKV